MNSARKSTASRRTIPIPDVWAQPACFTPMNADDQHMHRCFALARQALPHCRPNPAVGCVLVYAGKVVGKGHTQVAGKEHAEIMALQQAGSKAIGSTAYVSLEPCAHHGRTGPCADALIKAGVERVVYALEDPNPLVNGKGLAMLRAAGITVEGPLLAEEAELVNPGFNKRMRTGMPYTRMKLAMSLDGHTAMASGESQWITGAEARADVQLLRARSCAVLTGAGTLLKDDPQLTVRLPEYAGTQPIRVIVDSNMRTPASAKILQTPGRVLLACAQSAQPGAPALHKAATANGAELTIKNFADMNGRVDLRVLLRHLAKELYCNEVLIEAGATLGGVLMAAGLVDELIVYAAPQLLGSDAQPLLQLPGIKALADGIRLEFLDVAMVGKDCRMRLRVLPAA